ncbi:hypothetical protein DPM19_29765 [Actinomadura craniellae]|uniref:Uncharacterized protein n=1 Tax=Actinomadura craniellae TaxID=2231787 RepID=A0A365GXD5_9ACTN|nr:putative glycolipid-binding domain-containing protein [Actinomadura craniellae]RAY11495.1 hypothetical protein DPM19_29765 [Actinomadura craniellae]
MPFTAPPPAAVAWLHQGACSGFEVGYFHEHDGRYRIKGCTAAVEEGRTWVVDYSITLDPSWARRAARAG